MIKYLQSLSKGQQLYCQSIFLTSPNCLYTAKHQFSSVAQMSFRMSSRYHTLHSRSRISQNIRYHYSNLTKPYLNCNEKTKANFATRYFHSTLSEKGKKVNQEMEALFRTEDGKANISIDGSENYEKLLKQKQVSPSS